MIKYQNYNLIFIKIILLILIFSNLAKLNSKETIEYKFNWYPSIEVKDNIIIFPDSSKFETYNTNGVWEDNFGNYGMMKCLVSQFISNKKEIILNGYCEAKDNNKEKFWISLKRKSFNKAGVGSSKYLHAEKKYKVLEGKTCPYAAQLIEGGGVFKLICKLKKSNLNILKN